MSSWLDVERLYLASRDSGRGLLLLPLRRSVSFLNEERLLLLQSRREGRLTVRLISLCRSARAEGPI